MISLRGPMGRGIALFCLLALTMEVPRAAAWIVAAVVLSWALNRFRQAFNRSVEHHPSPAPFRSDDSPLNWPPRL